MATKKNSSTKTAHVLNVISTGDAAPDSSPVGAESVDFPVGQEAAPVRRHPSPPILDHAKQDDALAEQIRAAMEDELAPPLAPAPEPAPIPKPVPEPDALPQTAPTPEPVTTPDPEPIPVTIPVPTQAPPPVPAPESHQEPVQSTQSAPAAPAPQPAPQTTIKDTSPPLSYVNVMQTLVEEKAERYIKMFELCDCPRCVTDVKALALTNLPAKYVVMQPGEVVPMLTVYEGRFSSAISAQLIQACKSVMDAPRHQRDTPGGGHH